MGTILLSENEHFSYCSVIQVDVFCMHGQCQACATSVLRRSNSPLLALAPLQCFSFLRPVLLSGEAPRVIRRQHFFFFNFFPYCREEQGCVLTGASCMRRYLYVLEKKGRDSMFHYSYSCILHTCPKT